VSELFTLGSVVGSFPSGSGPFAIAFDGTHTWVANSTDNTVTRLNLDGTVNGLGPIPVGTTPEGIASDGTHMWVTNFGSSSGTMLKIT
jgi:DNA-binding beta-propeller fold protein YncE